ncbi:MAG: PAS domain S-box protein [Acidobacteriota bacterium]|nr:PAS domain S-box protein [Acidobacteriota bacterium]
MSRNRDESVWTRYALAAAAVATASGLTLALRLSSSAQGARVSFAFFYLAVFVAVWFGGRGPALFSIVLSAAVTDIFFLPAGLFAPDLSGLLPNVFFITISLLAVALIERSRRAEAAARQSRESLETTLKSIGDAVISTDDAGRVVFMNAMAERLTGWPLADARGRKLTEVFQIVNEETRAEVESPVAKVLREGQVVGLANHTMLIARDGSETPIDDSGAPIRDVRGQVTGVVLVFHDISERRKAERERVMLAAIVESSDDAILSKTLDGTITSWNRAAERMYGYAAEEVLGRHISLVVPPELSGELQEIMSRIRRGERVEHLETMRLRKDGTRIDASVTVSPLRDSSGRLVGASTIARDITEKKHAERERERLLESERRARRAAEEVNLAKDEFLATLSHELRTPLTPVLGWVHMILTLRPAPDEVERGLRVIQKNSETLSRLFNDLLDIASILSGKLRIVRAPVELGALVREAVETCRTRAGERSVALEVETEGTSRVHVSGDRTRLMQVVCNLLDNAVKFSPEGGRVRVRVGGRDGEARVEVSDEGEGIAPEFLPYVFERFRQADMATTRFHGGLGLGLALVKSLVEAHGGRVEAASAGVGRGSRFAFTLPVAQAGAEAVAQSTAETVAPAPSEGDEQNANERREQAASEGGGQAEVGGGERAGGTDASDSMLRADAADATPRAEGARRVLLIEDSRDTLDMLRVALAARGYTVDGCGSSEDALRVAESAPFDIIVSDIGLPRIDGYELIRRLRSLPHLRGVPALALTGYAALKDAEAALAAGFDAHVPKPVEPSALAEQVARLLRGASRRTGRGE